MATATEGVWLPVLPDMKGFGPALVKGAGSEADKSGKAVGARFGKALVVGTAAVGAAAGAVGVALYKVGEVFDDVGDTIRTGTGATGDALDGLIGVAKNVGTKVPAAFEDIGVVVADVNTRMGLSGETLEKVSSQYLEAGRILGEEVDIAKTSAAFNAFKIEGEDVVGAMDHLFQVSQATGMGMNELADAASRNAPAMQTLGFSFEETTAMVGSFDKAGLNSSQLMAAMSKGLVTLAKDGEEPAAAFKRVQGEIAGFIKKGDEAGALNLASKAFGTRGASQFIGAVKSGALSLEDMTKAAGQSGDTILGVGEETADFAEQWQLFKNNVLVWLEPMGSRVFGALGTIMGEVTDGVKAFAAAWEYNDGEVTSSGIPGFMERLGYWAHQAFDYLKNTALPAVKDFGKLLSDTFGPSIERIGNFIRDTLVPNLQGFGGELGGQTLTSLTDVGNFIKDTLIPALGDFSEWLLDNLETIGKVAAGIGLLLLPAFVRAGVGALASAGQQVAAWALAKGAAVKAGVVYVIQSLKIVGAWVLMGVQSLIQAGRMAAAWIIAMGPVGWVIAAVVGLAVLVIANWGKIKKFTVEAWKNIVRFVVESWANIKRGVSAAIEWVRRWIDTKLKAIKALWSLGWKWISDKVSAIWSGIKTGVANAIEWVRSTINGKLSAIKTLWGLAWNWVRDKVTSAFGSVKRTIKSVWENGVKPVLDVWAKILKGDFVGAFETARDAIKKVFDGLRGIAAKPINFIIGTVYNNGLRKALNKVIGVVGGKELPEAKEIPAFAKGGQMGRGWKLVGEEGPELINTGPGFVYTASQTQRMLQGRQQAPMGALDPLSGRLPIGGFWDDAKSKGKLALDIFQGTRHAVADQAGEWARGNLANLAAGLLNPIKEKFSTMLGGTVLGGIAASAGRQVIDGALGWIRGKDAEVVGGESGATYNGPLGAFHRPGGPITSGFGTSRGRYPHAGIDFAVPIGTAVRAMLNGVVRKIGWNAVPGRSGKGEVLDHANGLSSYYGHLSGWNTKPGDQVKAGQVIARSGNTGRSTGPHLHAELWKNGQPFNFASYLYDNGGVVNPGWRTVVNNSRKPEALLNNGQWQDISALAARGAQVSGGGDINFNGPVGAQAREVVEVIRTEKRRAHAVAGWGAAI